MAKNVVLLDVDGVLANWVLGIIETHRLDITHDQYESWDYHKSIGMTDDQLWAPTNTGNWWLDLPIYPWAKTMLESIEAHWDVVFCTSPNLDASCPSQKVAWLRKHGLLHPRKNNYQIGPRKELNARSGAVLIDDSESNVTNFVNNGGRAILFPQPWNRFRDVRDRVDFVLENLDSLREATFASQ